MIADKLNQLIIFAQATTSNADASGSCDPGTGGLFGLPAWNKYLVENGKYVWRQNTSTSSGGSECRLVSDLRPNDLWLIVEALADMVIYVVALFAVGMIIYAGFRMITSQGSPDTVKESRNTILYAVIGLVIAISAKAIIAVINNALNTNITTSVS